MGILDNFGKAFDSALNSFTASQDKKAAQQKHQAQMMKAQQEQNYKCRLWNFFESDYKKVGGALMDWIQANYDEMGLKPVNQIQNIMCNNIFDSVTGKLYEDVCCKG